MQELVERVLTISRCVLLHHCKFTQFKSTGVGVSSHCCECVTNVLLLNVTHNFWIGQRCP